MASKSHSVIGVFRSRVSADACFDSLLDRGYSAGDVAVMMSDATRRQEYAYDDKGTEGSRAGSMATEGAGVGGAVGLGIGATIAAIAAVGTSLVIPGLNLIVAGPVVAALAGGGAGALTGGLMGALAGLGIPEQDAEVYNKALTDGGVAMSISTKPGDDVGEVKKCMIQHGGEQVVSY